MTVPSYSHVEKNEKGVTSTVSGVFQHVDRAYFTPNLVLEYELASTYITLALPNHAKLSLGRGRNQCDEETWTTYRYMCKPTSLSLYGTAMK